MTKIKQLSVIGFALVFVLSSCSMDKRLYTSGYHIEWKNSNHNLDKTSLVKNNETKNNESTITTEQSESALTEDLEESENNITASKDNSIFIPASQKIDWNFSKTIVKKQTDSTKVKKEIYRIVKHDGTILIGEIISDDGREVLILTKSTGKISVNKSDIQEMKIIPEQEKEIESQDDHISGNANSQSSKKKSGKGHSKILLYVLCFLMPFVAVGLATDWNVKKVIFSLLWTLLVFYPGIIYAIIIVSKYLSKKKSDAREENKMAKLGFVFGLWSLLLTALTSFSAIVFSIIALTEIHKNPDKYNGKSKAKAIVGLVLGIIMSAFFILLWIASSAAGGVSPL